MANSPNYNQDLVAATIKHAKRIGADPLNLLTAFSYETGGTLNPWQRGPTTKWGQHIGLIQMGEPQRKKYGYNQGRSIDGLVGSAADYLVDNGYKAGMGLHQLYSTINTGSPYTGHRTDAHNGGAPGSAYDKVNNQMAGHRKKAANLLGGNTIQSSYMPQPQASEGEQAIDGMMSGSIGNGSQAGQGNTPRYLRQWDGEGAPPTDVFIDPTGRYEHIYGAGGQLDIERQNEGVHKQFEELERQEPGRYELVPANQVEAWKQNWDKDNKNKGIGGDTWDLLGSGVDALESSIEGAFRIIPGYKAVSDWFSRFINGKTHDEIMRDNEEWRDARYSDAMQEARQKNWVDVDEKTGEWNIGDAVTDWRSWYAGVMESLPSTAASMTPAGWAGKVTYARALAQGASKAQAGRAAVQAATIAGSTTEALLVGGASASEVRKEIAALPRETLEQSDAVKALMSEGKNFDEAIEILSSDAERQAFLLGGLAGGVFGGLGDRALGKILVEKMGGNLAKRTLRGAGRGFITEGAEETFQEGGQQMAQNAAMQTIDPNRDIWEGVPNAAAGGLAIGGAMGGGMGGAAGAASPKGPLRGSMDYAEQAAQERQGSNVHNAPVQPMQDITAPAPSGLERRFFNLVHIHMI